MEKLKEISRSKAFRGMAFSLLSLAVGWLAFFPVSTPEPLAAGSAEKKKASVDATLAKRIEELIPDTVKNSLGMYVYDLTADKEVFAFNPDRMLSTASNLKILTAMAAISQRGLHYNFGSRLYYNGTIQNGTLYGDVIMQMGFDPMVSSDSIADFVATIAHNRIRNIRGRLIIDMAYEKEMPNEEHWIFNDLKREHLSYSFGGFAKVKECVAAHLHSYRIGCDRSQIVPGKLAENSQLLQLKRSCIDQSLLYTLRYSSNLHAESILCTLGRSTVKDGKFREAGVEELKRFIKDEIKADVDQVAQIHDGCGLCPNDKLAPRLIVQLLRYAYDRKNYYDFMLRTLPVSAGKSGTLSRRMRKTPAAGKIHAKTGRLTRNGGVSSLSGYAEAKNGHTLVFSILQNGVPVDIATRWQDAVCQEFVK